MAEKRDTEIKKVKDTVVDYYENVAADYSSHYDESISFGDNSYYPANFIRLQMLVERIKASGIRSLYDIGAGEGTPMKYFHNMGLKVAGCDMSPSMVKAALDTLTPLGLSDDTVIQADIEDITSLSTHIQQGPYDAAIALGVLPHIIDEDLFFKNLKKLVKKKGKIFVEFRNKLFSLFTFNQHTRDFIIDDLLVDVSDRVRSVVDKDLIKRLEIGEDGTNNRHECAPSFSKNQARFHNPLELIVKLRSYGFQDIRLNWYHYHPAPPILKDQIQDIFKEEALRLEKQSDDWRGFFLCSAGVIEGTLQ